ncbi:hypothetical protein EJB05_06712, partial [Eragrostis curvula]
MKLGVQYSLSRRRARFTTERVVLAIGDLFHIQDFKRLEHGNSTGRVCDIIKRRTLQARAFKLLILFIACLFRDDISAKLCWSFCHAAEICGKVDDFRFSNKYAPQQDDSNASREVRGTANFEAG